MLYFVSNSGKDFHFTLDLLRLGSEGKVKVCSSHLDLLLDEAIWRDIFMVLGGFSVEVAAEIKSWQIVCQILGQPICIKCH